MPPLPPMTRAVDPTAAPIMTRDERARVRKAANNVNRLYPDPAGPILCRELMAWELFGWRLAHDAPIAKLVDHIFEQLKLDEAA